MIPERSVSEAAVVDFERVYVSKAALLALAFDRYKARPFPLKSFELFCATQAHWLEPVALFSVLKRSFNNACWSDWPVPLRDRHPAALAGVAVSYHKEIEREKFGQYLFHRQWTDLQGYCSLKGIGLIGDIPIYVNYDSVDVWVAPHFFKLDKERRPTFVAGVPPDYFSEDGQRWGNPVYDWDVMQANGFSWWVDRLRHNLALFDAVRIDHFRAFAQCWEIPAAEKTAVRGDWVDVPGMELFTVLKEKFARLPIIAEDLGIITPDVDALKEAFNFPGMRVVMFAFHNEYKKSRDLPENYVPNSIVYTGTHDNNTVRGWFSGDITSMEIKNMTEYLGALPPEGDIDQVMIRLAMGSVAGLCIIPVQDILGAGAVARMNTPSTVSGNWRWRLKSLSGLKASTARLKHLAVVSGRT